MRCISCGKPTFSSTSDFCLRCMDRIGAAVVARDDLRAIFQQLDLFTVSEVEKNKTLSG